MSPSELEELVVAEIEAASKGTVFEDKVEYHGGGIFPDITIDTYFGVEVKSTVADKWVSTGNSVLESTRVKGVEKIYIFFGKLGGEPGVRIRPYEECLHNIGVTHYPRYKINMDLEDGASIFEKMGVDYDTLRKDPIKPIKKFFREQLKPGEELWWIDNDIESSEVEAIIRRYDSLTTEEKGNFLVESMALFPEVFSDSNKKFERVAPYLIAAYGAVSPNIRDKFTAGGQVDLEIGNNKVRVPQIASLLHEKAEGIKRFIEEADEETLTYYWGVENLEESPVRQWEDLIDRHYSREEGKLKLSDIFEAGL